MSEKAKNSIIVKITNNLNKHGEIKGKSKKETKNLKAACFHHVINKKGNIKPRTSNDGAGHCTCQLCNHTFSTAILNKTQLAEIMDPMVSVVDQTKFIVAASGMGKEVEEYLTRFSVDMAHFKKVYKDVTHVAQKNENVKKKHKKHKGGNGGNGSENFGSWV